MSAHEKGGAEVLMATAVDHGVDVCFANPGTTEMPLVEALDRIDGMRAVLGLQENVCTGAADGYARITGRPALTLLHLGPGLANGWANLHNARRARTPIVNVVGDHASWHLEYDAPLTSDIAAVAGAVGEVYTVPGVSELAKTTATAIDGARDNHGVSTLIVPADFQQQACEPKETATRTATPAYAQVDDERLALANRRLQVTGARTVLLLGGNGLTRRAQLAAAAIADATGARMFSETFPARAERGGGLPDIDRLPYFPETAVAALRDADLVLLAGADAPVAYFGYDGIPSDLAQPRTLLCLARREQDAEDALLRLADAVGAEVTDTAAPPGVTVDAADDTHLTGQAVGQVVAAGLPADAIVSVEGGTCGYPFYTASADAAAHTVLTNTGGAIGQGLPVALGAAIAAPDRPVVAVQSDGSGLYTPQALWTIARERANVTILIAANRTYNVLRTELARHGNEDYGPKAASLTSLADPFVNWVQLAESFGIPAQQATTVGELRDALHAALEADGPHLIEMAL